MLLIRPLPELKESWRGYILRLSERNYLNNPKQMLRITNIDLKDLRTTIPPLSSVAKLTGHTEEKLREIFPLTLETPHILLLGNKVQKEYFRINSPKICPDCIRENKYISARWDIEPMNVCHIHKRHLISYCHDCSKGLTWYRNGMVNCKNGHKLHEHHGEPATVEEVHFAELLASKIEGFQIRPETTGSKIPQAFYEMELATFLGVTNTLGIRMALAERQNDRIKPVGSPEVYDNMVRLLSNWDYEFNNLMAKSIEKTSVKQPSIRASYERIYGALFKKGWPQKELEFIRSSFYKYAVKNNDSLFFDSRTKKKFDLKNTPHNYVGINEAAKLLGTMPSTLRKKIKKGEVKYQVHTYPSGQEKYLIDLNSIPQKLPNTKGDLSRRKAAAYVGIPVSTLITLRKLGYVDSNYKTTLPLAWAIQDLDDFIAKIESTANGLPITQCDDPIGILYCLKNLQFGSVRSKAEIIVRILTGHIQVFGIGKLKDLVISKTKAIECAGYLL